MKPYIHNVKYYECDRMGIVHHSNYLRFMEEARCDLLEQLGYPFNKMEEEGIVSPVVSISIDYKKPTTFTDDIEITIVVGEMTDLKVTFGYTMKVGGALACKATSTHCFLGPDHRPVVYAQKWPDLTERLRELLVVQQ
ncbi:MAG: acyl-CoA thioesterase [Bacteroidales bacterium]|nr:acyl-CoA thioesterase [Bacteroidales bacterium]